MNPGPLDHLVAFLLVVAFPVYGALTYPKLVAAVRAGRKDARVNEYRWTAAIQWALVALTLTVWLGAGRSLPALGLTVPGDARTLVGAALAALGLGLLAAQWAQIRRADDSGRAQYREALRNVQEMMPHTGEEGRWFRVLSVTAGICEEILFRGFLIAYFGAYVGVWPAVALSAVAFGFGHFYQGAAGVVKTGLVGAVAGALYAGTGSLLWPMLLHAAVDLQAGAIALRVLPEAPPPAPAAWHS